MCACVTDKECLEKGRKGEQERNEKYYPSKNIKTNSDFPLYLVGQMVNNTVRARGKMEIFLSSPRVNISLVGN